MPSRDFKKSRVWTKMTIQEEKKAKKLLKDVDNAFKLMEKYQGESTNYSRKFYKLKNPTASQIKKEKSLIDRGFKYEKKAFDKSYKYNKYMIYLEKKY